MHLAILMAIAGTCSYDRGESAPLAWSPDSRWIAFSELDSPFAPIDPAWVLFPDELLDNRSPTGPDSDPKAPVEFRLQLYSVADRRCRTLERSPFSIGGPAWAPDGGQLAYLRRGLSAVTAVEESGTRLELVLRGAAPEVRVLWSRSLEADSTTADPAPDQSAAWSPDGRMIAFGLEGTATVVVVDSGDGSVLAEFERASRPSWRLDSGQLAFLRPSADGAVGSIGLWEVDSGRIKEIHLLAEPPRAAPTWLAKGRSIAMLGTQVAADGQAQVVLYQINPSLGRVEGVKSIDNPIVPPERLTDLSLAISRDGLHQFYSVVGTGREPAITQHRGRQPMDRFPILGGDAVPIGLALSPDGTHIALGLRSRVAGTMPAVLEVSTRRLIPIVTGAAGRDRWLALLVESARSLLDPRRQAALDGGEPGLPLPTLVPIPGWLDRADPAAHRLRIVESLALPLLESTRAVGSETPSDLAARLLLEAARGDARGSLAALDRIESRIVGGELRDRILGLRAQLELAAGDRTAAESRIAYLRERAQRPAFQLDDPGDGSVRIREVDRGDAWIDALGAESTAEPAPEFADPPEPAAVSPTGADLSFPGF